MDDDAVDSPVYTFPSDLEHPRLGLEPVAGGGAASADGAKAGGPATGRSLAEAPESWMPASMAEQLAKLELLLAARPEGA